MSWKNRIVGHGEQAAISFMANPLNWRIHPKAQREALTGVLSEVGWVQSVIVNRTTGNVIDGHARIEEALKLGDETPVPFVEVDLGGWDNHQNIFRTLQNDRLPVLDKAMAALTSDLSDRGLLEDTCIIWMGEFSRTPRINADAGRDHWARAWSVVVGGAGIKGGQAVGATNEDGTEVVGEPYSSEDLMASVCHALGISLETTFTSKNGRPMKIANSGKLIKDLFA